MPVFLHHFMNSAPPAAWWLPLLALIALGLSAAIDAFTSLVPDLLILPASLVTVVAEGVYVSWRFAFIRLGLGLAAALVIRGLNKLWQKMTAQHALGMGDAKWTWLAVLAFGLHPALIAWGAGACLAVLWIAAARIVGRRLGHVHFAPFLFVGLVGALISGF